MATVKDTLDRAARRCSITPPSNWVTSTTSTAYEFKDLLQETVEEMLDRVDWPDPITKDVAVTYSGSPPESLPTDFLRMTRDENAVFETTSTRRQVIPVRTNGEWTYLEDIGTAAGNRYYRVQGDEGAGFTIEFYRALASGDSITVSYVSRNWLRISSTEGESWTDVSAVLLLPPDIVRLGVVWRFRQRKGLPYSDILAEYEARLARAANDRRGIRSINMGDVEPRSPFDIPVPDYIPSS